MEIAELLAEGERVVGRSRCSATHLGTWNGHPATGRRFERVDEVDFFTVRDDRIAAAWGLEDTDSRSGRAAGRRRHPASMCLLGRPARAW